MPEYIYDTDTNLDDGVTTFSTIAGLLAKISSDTGGGNFSGYGQHVIRLRCSSAIPCIEALHFSGLTPNAVDNLQIIGEFSNENPFVLSEPEGTTETNPISLNDNFIELTSSGFGAALIMARQGEAHNRSLIANYNAGNKINGWILWGGESTTVGGIYTTADTIIENMLFMGCRRGFYGAVRSNRGTTLNKCTIYSCAGIRNCGEVTNSLFLRTDLETSSLNDGLVVGCDNNAFDVDQSLVRYESTPGDANSFFGIAENTETAPLLIGASAIKATSILAGVASDGGAVGAFGMALVAKATVTSNITRGNNFVVQFSGHRAGVSALVTIKEVGGLPDGFTATLVSYDDFSLVATAPVSMPVMSAAVVEVLPILSQ